MTDYERGPLLPYQVIWKSGHVEEIRAHQVLVPSGFSLFGEKERNRLLIHGEIEGRWQLLLDADYDEISSVRRVFENEPLT